MRFFWLSQLRCGKRTILGSLVDVLERSCSGSSSERSVYCQERIVSSSLGGMAGMSGKPARGLRVGAGGAVGWVGTRGGGWKLGRGMVGGESDWKVGSPRA